MDLSHTTGIVTVACQAPAKDYDEGSISPMKFPSLAPLATCDHKECVGDCPAHVSKDDLVALVVREIQSDRGFLASLMVRIRACMSLHLLTPCLNSNTIPKVMMTISVMNTAAFRSAPSICSSAEASGCKGQWHA